MGHVNGMMALGGHQRGLLAVMAAAAILTACSQTATMRSPASPALAFEVLGYTQLPPTHEVEGTLFGGISGIDRDPRTGDWFLVSDDRSEHAPARFHVGDIDLDRNGIAEIRVRKAIPIRTRAGALYPSPGSGAEAIDAEAIRFDPASGELWWTTEGDASSMASPALRRMAPDGYWRGEVSLTRMLVLNPALSSGARPNLSFEGLDWSADGKGLWLAMEAPLLQDGPLADTREGALVRFSLLSRDGALLMQRAYRTDPVPEHPPGRLADNGVSEILDLGGGQLLVMERSGVQRESGGFRFHVRLYCASVDAGQEISRVPTLAGRAVRPASKRLMLDLAQLPDVPQANFEGMAWGPVLDDGRATLLLVSDNNFDPNDGTVFVLLASSRARDEAWLRTHCPGEDAP
ncbi:esterase-like activity of phytase family protein [Pseudoxanthomonas putridarboris]|uniref:Esterase-like activity of phytase family protein n=1 Tax=Pseudoxanthomonas putridarboris TaxID=752605 RepID=A0ABU9IYR1_9GAMM